METGNRHPVSILVVEDDPAVGRSLGDALKREGYAISWKTTGAEGIEFAEKNRPDLIILDLRLPDGSGFDVCRTLRNLKMRLPILMLTARTDEMDKVLGLELGADDYVTKPYAIRELLSRIRSLLRRSYGELSSTEANVLYVEDLIIDVGTGQVSRGEESINLTPTEFRLLAYLARHPGQALTRSQILDAVWGYSAQVESESAVNVHVRRLRQKVEIDPSRPSLILTVPGVGYRLAG